MHLVALLGILLSAPFLWIALCTRAVRAPRAMVIISALGLMFGDGMFLWGHIVSGTVFLVLSVCLLGMAWGLIYTENRGRRAARADTPWWAA